MAEDKKNPTSVGQRLMENKSQGLAWLNQGYTRLFFEFIEGMQKSAEHDLRSAESLVDIFRAQGSLEKLEKVLAVKSQLLASQEQDEKRRR